MLTIARRQPRHPIEAKATPVKATPIIAVSFDMLIRAYEETQSARYHAANEVKAPYETSSTVTFLPLNVTVSPARAPSIALKIGAIVEMPMSSRPRQLNLLVDTAITK